MESIPSELPTAIYSPVEDTERVDALQEVSSSFSSDGDLNIGDERKNDVQVKISKNLIKHAYYRFIGSQEDSNFDLSIEKDMVEDQQPNFCKSPKRKSTFSKHMVSSRGMSKEARSGSRSQPRL